MVDPVPSHVYDAIDSHIGSKQYVYAWNAISKAISEHEDLNLDVCNCLWLYQKGALVASQLVHQKDSPVASQIDSLVEKAMRMGTRFVTMGQKLIDMDAPRRDFELRTAQIRPPRQDEIDAIKTLLAKMERAYRERQTAQGKSVEAVNADVSKFKAVAKTSGGCFTLALTTFGGLVGLTVIIVKHWL